jgi:3',5'-cyclic AMP phosphodiesterase CpdA
VRIAQITDLHVTDREGGLRLLADPDDRLERAVTALAGLPARPDVVLLTGDLTDHGTEAQYALLLELLAPLDVPLLPIPGNHDDSRVFRTALARLLPADLPDGHVSYVVDEYPVRLVGLDTTDPDRHDGVLPHERIQWLDTVLREAPGRPTLVFMHHPPFETGIWWMDLMALEGAAAFREVIERHPQVRLVVAGHIHRAIQTTIGGSLVSVCPSTAHQLGLDLVPGEAPTLSDEPPGFQMHCWNGSGFVTHTGILGWDGRVVGLGGLLAKLDALRDRPAGGLSKTMLDV